MYPLKFSKRTLNVWHRRIGVVSSLAVLLLSISGFLINRSELMGFSQRYVQSVWVLKLYGVEHKPPTGVAVNNIWVSAYDHHLFVGQKNVAQCSGRYLGATSVDPFVLAVCGEQWLLLDLKTATLVDQQYQPEIDALANCDFKACVKRNDRFFYFDANLFEAVASVARSTKNIQIIHDKPIPKALRGDILQNHRSQIVSWEKVIVDLHAGRFLGSAGPWVMDFIALTFLLLAASGIVMWSRRRSR